MRPRAVVFKFSKSKLKYKFVMFMHREFYAQNYHYCDSQKVEITQKSLK